MPITLVPTSDPFDSYHAYSTPRIGPSDGPYVHNVAVPGPVSIQTAIIWRAPTHQYRNPEFYMAAELPRQAQVAAIGAPPVPYANPRYLEYQANVRVGNSTYAELIGAYAPRPSAGLLG